MTELSVANEALERKRHPGSNRLTPDQQAYNEQLFGVRYVRVATGEAGLEQVVRGDTQETVVVTRRMRRKAARLQAKGRA